MHNIIYTSEKVMPYVYTGVHKETGHFYFGSRFGEKCYIQSGRSSDKDFGFHYFTSSSKIKQLGFDNFNWTILAEFFDYIDAIKFEDFLILENWKNPLLLNGHVNGKFITNNQNKSGSNNGMFGRNHSEESKKKMSKPKSELHKQNLSKNHADVSGENNPMFGISRIAWNKGLSQYLSESTLLKLKEPKSPEHKQKLSIAGSNRPKIECPHCHRLVDVSTSNRWHFNNCKSIFEIVETTQPILRSA